MSFVLELQNSSAVTDDENRSCNIVSAVSCSVCSLSIVSIGLCLG